MNRSILGVAVSLVLLAGCATPQRGSIPIVESGAPVSNGELYRTGGVAQRQSQAPTASYGQAASTADDAGVQVMAVPSGAAIQSYPVSSGAPLQTGSTPIQATQTVNTPSATATRSAPTGIPSSSTGSGGQLAADEQLDGPVLALLSTAQTQQGSGDLNGASSSLERAQRIAPREPQVLYRLAQVRLAQNQPAQAEQFARRGLGYANGRPQLQAGLWELIAQSREKQGDTAGAAQARQNARRNG